MISILLQILVLQILPIAYVAPSLVLEPCSMIETMVLFIILYTQPKITAHDRQTDKYSIFGIMGSMVISIVSVNYEWAIATKQDAIVTNYIGFVIAVMGICIRLWAISTLGSYFHATVKVMDGQLLIETGPYRYIRHPSYSGALFCILGICIMLETYWTLCLSFLLFIPAYWYRISQEEKLLCNVFGEKYKLYTSRTNKLIPLVW